MERRFKLILTSNNVYKEVSLSDSMEKVSVGTEVDADVRLRKQDFFEPFSFVLTNNEGYWDLECDDNIFISNGAQKLLAVRLEIGKKVHLKYPAYDADFLTGIFMQDFDYAPKKYNRQIHISSIPEIRIGSRTNSHIILRHTSTRNDNISIRKSREGYILFVDSKGYGTSLNGREINKSEILSPLDFISIGPYSFCLQGDSLYTDSGSDMSFRDVSCTDHVESYACFEYPKFNRSTRIKKLPDDEKIEILDPPQEVQKPRTNILTQLFPSIAMLAVIVLLRGVMNTTGISYILISACSMGVGIISSIMSIVTERKRYKSDVEKRNTTYQQYIEKKKKFIEEKRKEEAAFLEEKHYSIPRELSIVDRFLPELFQKEAEDDDFLEVRLGTGERESYKKTDYKKRERVEDGDELMAIPEQIQEQYKMIKNVPVTLGLSETSIVGITGSRSDLYNMLKILTLDLAVRHYYTDVQFLYCIGEQDDRAFSWLRMLPHIQNERLNRRNIICDDESRNVLFEYLYKEMSTRGKNFAGPRLIVFLYKDRDIQTHPVSELMKNAKDKGVTFLYFNEYMEKLPKNCDVLLKLRGGKGYKIDCNDSSKTEKFEMYQLEDQHMMKAVRKLAPVYCEKINLESTLTKNISFFELMHIYDPEDLNLERNWAQAKVAKSLAAPLGVKSKNQVICLDIHEKAHGPHGLVAGTTGSGKSEILQSYILSMAIHYHPYEVGFVIIDFKGGGMVNQFKKLPHLVGAITNIDGREIDRSLLSIRAELKKRQELFAEYGVNHIDAYIDLYKQRQAVIPLPHLILIVDEFAELKMEQPEFMKELISAARIGRSLGVHLILATQKPSGVVDPQIWSNSRFKLCLKVQGREDSNEVLKTPLAAEITEPGRAYLQVGNNEIFELFQSAYSGGSSKIGGVTAQKEFSISKVLFSGKRIPVFEQKKESNTEKEITQLESIVSYIECFCNTKNIERLPFIFLPGLPEMLQMCDRKKETVRNGLCAYPGIYDDPANQYQGDMKINVSAENTFIVGSAQNGKTNLLQVILRSLVAQYTPEQVNIYVLDFGTMTFRNFESLNHIGGVVCSFEEEKCKNLFKMLGKEMAYRKEKLSSVGVSSFAAYLEAGFEDMPQIVVMIDNLTAMMEMYLKENDFLLPMCMEGLAVGISFVIANSQTSGITYKYLANFERRIALYCNTSTEYGVLFDGCRVQPYNTPGRCLVSYDKTIYEAQIYLAFDGEKEIDRVHQMEAFVAEQNSINADMYAKPIPVVPRNLSKEILEKRFKCRTTREELALGLDYATVAPLALSWMTQSVLALCGLETLGRNALVRHITAELEAIDGELYVLDDVFGTFADCQNKSITRFYGKSVEDVGEVLSEIMLYLKERYTKLAELGDAYLSQESPIVLYIQNPDVINAISTDKNLMAQYKEIIGKYKNLKVCIIYTNIDNAPIKFSSPEVLKMMQDNRQFIVFENIDNIKLADIITSTKKKYAKPLEFGEAYMITDSSLKKVKFAL